MDPKFFTILNQENLQVFYQLLLAVFLGSLIGLERQLAKKTAGMRTYALVALGSCLFAYLSKFGFVEFWGTSGFSPSLIASQVVTGVGFICAGLIIFREHHLSGLTTAAGLWVVAAIGMAVGLKFFALAIFTTILTLVVFVVFWVFEEKIIETVDQK